MIAGRVFPRPTRKLPPVAVVSEKFASTSSQTAMPSANRFASTPSDAAPNQWRQIVGIVHNVKSWPLNYADDPEIYEPFSQHPAAEMAVVVRAKRRKFARAGLARSGLVP